MSGRWYFNKLRPGDKTRESTLGEFFATEAIRNSAEALVREAIQNSLDAGLKDSAGRPIETVLVRILLSQNSAALPGSKVAKFFAGAWDHLRATGNGLKEAPLESDSCPFFVYEDFGTSGLEGDVNQWHDKPDGKNAFFYFFRAEGRTGKGGDDRGRWGIGKYVFARSSRANSFFGLTVRASDNERLLMGQAVLKSHAVGNDHYKPDGAFGILAANELVLPISEDSFVEEFRTTFGLRRNREPGLSLVIPWVDPEITRESLLAAVVRGYFYPILTGSLAVTVATSAGDVDINDSTLLDVAASLGSEVVAETIPLIELAEWASSRKPVDVLTLKAAPVDRPVWAPSLIPAEALDLLRAALEQGERMALRVPLTVRAKGCEPRSSYFDIFLRRDGYESGRPVFLREGLIISDVRAPRARGVRSLVIAEDKALATLLGDSENPAHTQWQRDSSNFRGKYFYGKSYLDFVTRSTSEIVRYLGASAKEEDRDLLIDFFSLPAPPDAETPEARRRKKKKRGKLPDDEIEPIEPRKKRYRIQQISGGFSVSKGEKDAPVPDLLDIRVAYVVRRGRPLGQYDPADFELDKSPIRFEPPPVGAMVQSCSKNRALFEVTAPDFHISVVGFDANRDVFVDVDVKAKPKADDSEV